MNKSWSKMQKTVESPSGIRQLIARLEKLSAQLENPELTVGEFNEIKEKVLEIQSLLKKVS